MRSQVETYVQVFELLVVLILHIAAELTHLRVGPVVLEAIVEDQLHMLQKLFDASINMVFQILFDCSEVHWVLDHLEVVVNSADFLSVDWLVEDKGAFVPPQGIHHPLSCLFPVV